MKKKLSKLMALALSVVMVLSLALPAFAVEDLDPPLWERFGYTSMDVMLHDYGITEEEYALMVEEELAYEAEVAEYERQILEWVEANCPEEAAAFDSTAFIYKAFGISVEEFMESFGCTEEEVHRQALIIWGENKRDEVVQQQERADFIAAHPTYFIAFDPYAYFEENIRWDGSAENYMSEMRITEEEFEIRMIDRYIEDIQYEEMLAEDLKAEKESHGGYGEGINVMVDGMCIPFPDARPEITNDRTMVPMAIAMDYLGAEVTYSKTEHAARVSMPDRDFYLYHKIGTSELVITDELPNGKESALMTTQVVQMDTPSYIKEGRTMVPVAFFAQALGFDVFWDEVYETAVLLDRKAVIKELDQDFTQLNRVLYSISGEGLVKKNQSLRTDLALKLSLTAFDETNGDQKVDIAFDADLLSNDVVAQGSYEADLLDLLNVFMEVSDDTSELTDEELAIYKQYKAALEDMTVDIIISLEDSCIYLRSDSFYIADLVDHPDTWLALSLPAFPVDEDPTLGALLLAYAFADNQPFLAWDEFSDTAEVLHSIASDNFFTPSGNSNILSWSQEDPYGFLSFARLRVTPMGSRDCRFTFTFKIQDEDMSIDMEANGVSGKVVTQLNVHIEDLLKIALNVTGYMSATTKQPVAAPPAEDKIVPTDDFPLLLW